MKVGDLAEDGVCEKIDCENHSSDWYECPRCDAGYADQECVCDKWVRDEDTLDDLNEKLYDDLIAAIRFECFGESWDWNEHRMRARLREILEK